jgi:hypothetical protein
MSWFSDRLPMGEGHRCQTGFRPRPVACLAMTDAASIQIFSIAEAKISFETARPDTEI